MQFLKESIATTVVVGPFVDDTDGVTAETALAIAQADIRLSKDGAAFAQSDDVSGATHMENGYYSVPLATTDTGTLGSLTLTISKAGALPVFREFTVLPAAIYDAMVSGVGLLDVNATVTGQVQAQLTSDGLDNLAVTPPASGAFSTWTFRELLVMLGRRFLGKTTHDRTANKITVFNNDGVTKISEQTATDDGTTETQDISTPA